MAKAVAIGRQFSVVVAERLFVEVVEQVKRFNANVGSKNATLQERPEVLKTVGVNLAVNICGRVVDYLVRIMGVEAIIEEQFIGIKRGLLLARSFLLLHAARVCGDWEPP